MKYLFFITVLTCLPWVLSAQENKQKNESSNSIVVGRYSGNDVQTLEPFQELPSEKRVRFSLDVGYSYRIASIVKGVPREIKDLINKMRGGLVYGADFHYFFDSDLGIGAKYSGHHYSHSESGFKISTNTNYFAPSFVWRLFDRRNNAWVFGTSIGYLSFREKYTGLSDFSKGGLGSSLDLGYDIRLAKNTFLGLKFSFIGGSVSVGKDNAGKNVSESLSAIEFSGGLRF